MKKYCVYLDESGDFDKELDDPKKKPSLVGGYYYGREDMAEDTGLVNRVREMIANENHATELDAAGKGQKVYDMLTSAHNYPIEFVIFQDDIRKKIINSTQTYLTVITEGLVQLLKRLVSLHNEPVELAVIAGFKKDTTQTVTNSMVEGYIPLSDYEMRILEKLAIEKAKLMNPHLEKSVIKVNLADDKREPRLVICDYICNFWLTRDSRAFSGMISRNGTSMKLKDALEALYKDDNIFPMFITEQDEHVMRMLQDGIYADALFEVCAGNLSEKNNTLIRDSFLHLKPKQIHRQLSNLADYIGELLVFRQEPAPVEAVLERADFLYHFLCEHSVQDDRFFLDIRLYLLAYLNNCGRFAEMEPIFAETEPVVANYTRNSLNSDYLLIFYTRKAVYLLDHNRYREAIAICENMESHLLFLEDAIKNNDCILLEGEIRSEQLGKILGTKLQAQIPLCYRNADMYERAQDSSDRAIAQFSFETDLMRQYQYRAELEAVCGNQTEALDWIEKSFRGKTWKQHIAGPGHSIYDLYNLLYIAAFTKETNEETSLEIANAIYQSCISEIKNDESMCGFCMVFMGITMLQTKQLDARGRKILSNYADGEADQEKQEVKLARCALAGGNALELLCAEA